MPNRRWMEAASALAVALAMLALAGCASSAGRQSTSNQIDRVLAGSHRPEANVARDLARHPRQTLLFFGIRPDMTVVEIEPGAGWYTEILAPLLRDNGRLSAALTPPSPQNEYDTRGSDRYKAFLARFPALYDKVEIAPFSPGKAPLAAPGSVDMILTFRSLHNWMRNDEAAAALASMFAALKPGGVLGIEEHRGNPAVAQDPKARSGYVNQSYAVRLIESVGFRLVATAEINANPKDTKDYPKGVWTLPPSLAEGDKDRARYVAIGESDRFTLKFVKPR